MKLEPVYVLAPLPAPKSMPTRRAWVLCTASAFLSSAAGFALGSLCARSGGPAAPAPGPPAQATDPDDVTLAWLLGLARPETSTEELLENLSAFVYLVPRRYPQHRVLWDAMGRMADALLAGPATPARRRGARDLGTCFAAHAQGAGRPELAAKAPDLQRVGGR